jgi:tRNA (mo5U34)-methyltransferase
VTPFDGFFAAIRDGRPGAHEAAWRAALQRRYVERPHGDEARWQGALDGLPAVTPSRVELDRPAPAIGSARDLDARQQQALLDALGALMPWRKGPFELFGTLLDAEWRSDRKWQRLAPHLDDLAGRRVLDVGCGNGYFLWRLRGAGAAFALGIDPTRLFLAQFRLLQRYLGGEPVFLLPLRDEDLPPGLADFDTVMSMGVIYHRRDPLAHLALLREAARPGAQLVVETLILDSRRDEVLEPRPRYAQMRNVWQIPSPARLRSWLTGAGLTDVDIVDVTRTGVEEQRRGPWMRFHSLADFLDPRDPDRTIEGYPAPRRAIAIARRAG